MSKINWQEALKWNEDQLEELRLVGYSYLRQGKYDIALTLFEALCVLDPNNVYDTQTLGAIHLQLNNPTIALQHLNQALKGEADHTSTLMNMTKAFFMLGKREEALKLAMLLRNEPNLTIANTAKALILAYS